MIMQIQNEPEGLPTKNWIHQEDATRICLMKMKMMMKAAPKLMRMTTLS
jgi:hypothetical protein